LARPTYPDRHVEGVGNIVKPTTRVVVLNTGRQFFGHMRKTSKGQASVNLFGHEAPAPTADRIAADFERFWDHYPKRVGRLPAWQVWERMQPSVELVERILTALEAQCRSRAWLKDGGEFVPHAKTWLFQQRWTDEVRSSMERVMWECPHTPHCPHRAACAIVAMRKK
jgi:hypothetical protein